MYEPRARWVCVKSTKKTLHILRNALSAPVSRLLHGTSVGKLLTMRCRLCWAGEVLTEGDGASLGSASPHVRKHLKKISLNRDALISVQNVNLSGYRLQSAHQHSPSGRDRLLGTLHVSASRMQINVRFLNGSSPGAAGCPHPSWYSTS